MSWHTSAVVIEGEHGARAAQLLADLGFPGLRAIQEVDGDEAGRSTVPGKAVGVVSGWTLIWDPSMFVPNDTLGTFATSIWAEQLDAALVRLSQHSRVFSFLTEGSSGTHGFAWYAAGVRRRLRLWQEGEIVFDDGAPLDEEEQVYAQEHDEEQRLFLLLEALTGIPVDSTFGVRFSVLA